jgi:hypothetical protein
LIVDVANESGIRKLRLGTTRTAALATRAWSTHSASHTDSHAIATAARENMNTNRNAKVRDALDRLRVTHSQAGGSSLQKQDLEVRRRSRTALESLVATTAARDTRPDITTTYRTIEEFFDKLRLSKAQRTELKAAGYTDPVHLTGITRDMLAALPSMNSPLVLNIWRHHVQQFGVKFD